MQIFKIIKTISFENLSDNNNVCIKDRCDLDL